MPARGNRPIHPLNQARGQLETLLHRAGEHQSLEAAVLAALPDNLAESCRFAGCQNGELTLIVADSTRASQARFQQRSLLRALREDERFGQLWRIRTRVQHWLRPVARRADPPPLLSPDNARMLRQEADQTEDTELGEVLRRIATHSRKPGNFPSRSGRVRV